MKKHVKSSGFEEVGTLGANAGVSRRSFLAGALSVGALAASTSVLGGCAPASNATEGTNSNASSAAVAHSPSEVLEYDVVVVGSGTGGMSAAVRAAQLGGSVILLEKNGAVGGTSNFAESVAGVGSKMQDQLNFHVDKTEVFTAAQNYHHDAALGPILHKFIDESGKTIDWLMEEGVQFLTVMDFFGDYPVCHLSGNPETGSMLNGEAVIQPLLASAEALGVDIRVDMPMTDLVVEDGVIKGVYAGSGSQEIQVNAKGTILATGGYADNAELFEEFTLMPFDSIHAWGMSGRDGDGIKAARKLGASLHHPETLNYSGERVVGTSAFYETLNQVFAWQVNPRVNENAERFWNEAKVQDFSSHGNALTMQAAGYSILDQDFLDMLANVTVFSPMPMYDINIGSPLVGAYDVVEQAVADGMVFKADTVAELAEALELDPAALQKTIDEYNEMCTAGKDAAYGKDASLLFPVKTAPFYGSLVQPTVYATNGGVKVNENLQVMAGKDPIDGLYAIGNDAGGLYGNNYDVAVMPGSCQGWAATGGRLAAEHILDA